MANAEASSLAHETKHRIEGCRLDEEAADWIGALPRERTASSAQHLIDLAVQRVGNVDPAVDSRTIKLRRTPPSIALLLLCRELDDEALGGTAGAKVGEIDQTAIV